MISVKFFPSVMLVLQVCSALVYARAGNWRQFGYWISAAVLTACVTY